MAVRPLYPSAAAKQAAYRARKHATQALAAQECAAIQQELQTRTLADQSWELHELIDACSRDRDMPRRAQERRERCLPRDAIACLAVASGLNPGSALAPGSRPCGS